MPSDDDIIVEYELKDVLGQIEGVWTWNFRYLESTKFFFPDNIDMIFVSDKPVLLDEKKAINCHGCQMILQYFEDRDVQTETVRWEESTFEVPIISPGEVTSFRFDQPSKSISFVVNDDKQFVTAIISI